MDVMAQFEKAIQHKVIGEYDEALAALRPLLQTHPDNAEVYHELGLIHSFKVDMDESIYYLEMAVRLSPQSVPYMLDAGKTHAMFGNDDKAKAIFEYILKLDPVNVEAQKNLAFYS
ncbi:MAG: tetratricopeptide repeat protein [Akkermansiaceae bacterium]|nr:tetratricopeptide repeat protein [Armatimonadota bacterium]